MNQNQKYRIEIISIKIMLYKKNYSSITVRMKYRFSDVYSDKNSHAIIYVYLKMHCLKYVANFIFILIYSIFLYSCGPGVAI